MSRREKLNTLAAECEQELKGHILPFWMNLRDPRGGFYLNAVNQVLAAMAK